jgi:hypothetical protein
MCDLCEERFLSGEVIYMEHGVETNPTIRLHAACWEDLDVPLTPKEEPVLQTHHRPERTRELADRDLHRMISERQRDHSSALDHGGE